MRKCGILLPISALPSKYGIGTFGQEAYDFINFLQLAKQSYWQVLPLGPTSYGDSPYQSFCAYAGNPYFIDLDLLKEDGLLNDEDFKTKTYHDDKDIDIEAIKNSEKMFEDVEISSSAANGGG